MEEFKVLLEVKYKENKYKILVNKNHQKYFIKVLENKGLIYPTLEEFKELYSIFGCNQIKEKHFGIKSCKHGKKIKLEPKIIFKNTLISLAMALTIIGGTKILTSDLTQISLPAKEDISNTQSEEINAEKNEIEEMFEQIGAKIEQISDNLFVVKSIENEESIYCHSANEFTQYLDVQNPTFDDVKQALENNENIKDEYKNIIRNGINILQEKMPDVNLSALYYNISRMKIYEKESEQIRNETTENVIAYFNIVDSSVSICPDSFTEETFVHEVLGHGMTSGMIKNGDKKVQLVTEMIIYDSQLDDGNNLNLFGSSMAEEEADLITQQIVGDDILKNGLPYSPVSEQLKLYMEIAEMDISDLINNGSIKLVKKMLENDIENPLDYLEKNDVLCNALINGLEIVQPEMSVKKNIKELFWDYADNKLERGESIDKITANIRNMISNTSIGDLLVWNIDGTIAENLLTTDVDDEVISYIEDERDV